MNLIYQITWLFVLAMPIACISWTITHEEVFREPREFCQNRYNLARTLMERKFYYLFTCEYCFSHYVTIFFLVLTQFKLMLEDWRGYLVAGFALVWLANVYMSLFAFLRQYIKKEKKEIDLLESYKAETEKAGPGGEPT